MKICIVNTYYYPDIIGGAEISVKKLAEELAKSGHNVHVICTGKQDEVNTINGVTIHRTKVNNVYTPIEYDRGNNKKNKLRVAIYKILNIYNLLNYTRVNRLLNKINPDIVHTNNLYGLSTIVWEIANKKNIPVVHTLRDYAFLKEKKDIISRIQKKIITNYTRNVDLVTAPSQYTLDTFKNNGYFSKSTEKVVYNAIDFKVAIIEEVLNLKKERIRNKNIINFVYLGRIEEKKGIKVLLNSFSKVKNDNIQLNIAGDGNLKYLVSEQVKRDSRINYLGFLNETEIEKLLKESDVLIIPSIWPEPFGRVIIEAYKHCMPAIGSKIGGIPELINNMKTGLLIAPNNESELMKAIEYFSNKKNIQDMLVSCKEKVDEFDIKTQIIKFESLYKGIVDRSVE